MGLDSKTYPFTRDDPAPEPDSAILVEATRICALADALGRSPDFTRPHESNQPLKLHQLTSAAKRLRLSAAAFGSARDIAAAEAAEAAVAAAEAVWLGGTVTPPEPPKPEPVEEEPVEDRGEHTLGRPKVGDVIHLDQQDGRCRVAWVMELRAGKLSQGDPDPSPRDPLLRVAPVEDPSRPVLARYVREPTTPPPGFAPPLRSWHRQGECKR